MYYKHHILLFSCLLLAACSQQRQVVPYEIDTDEIYQAWAPNEEDMPEGLTFGPDSIPGFIFDYEMTSDKENVYIFLDNLTVLDVNPEITQSLFDFVYSQLSEYGFISDKASYNSDEISRLQAEGFPYDQASAKVIEHFQTDFNNQIETIEQFNTPFNAHFQIYPIYFTKDIVTYRLSAYCYTGGAHSMNTSYIRSYNLASGKCLGFDDIVAPQGREIVRQEIAAHMAYSYPIYENITTVDQYIDSLNVWLYHFDSNDNHQKITLENFPTGDVALVKEGLVSVYQMYELTPGSDGCPVVVIPYKDIKGCLTGY